MEGITDEPQRQRFEQGYRLVAGCIPYRLKKGGSTPHAVVDNVRILMISSLNGHGLVFPKGGWEFDETVEDAACREAAEEAGVRGQIKEELGHWIFASKRHDMVCTKGNCKAYMFALEVTQELETWPEQEARRRQWFTIATAIEKVRHAWMREALEKCREYLQQQIRDQLQPTPCVRAINPF
ncbi:hypothetical protein SELMODRAFT_99897 [Selaginella moellendorffii]|uniref:Nudix hydrolase domain-containing protein n=1 Tax=Selaginella moellendorffii TaxID=88036 RepID=D8RRE0_SELML|nr:hypothetical protein SELMODRAFT_99897 [Selaginella moellendorffii]